MENTKHDASAIWAHLELVLNMIQRNIEFLSVRMLNVSRGPGDARAECTPTDGPQSRSTGRHKEILKITSCQTAASERDLGMV
ncbi:hypothetical protein EVAR_53357_1 [Eumeta japonica]|uniref:Uncharacterized protein n=1 Tax=Eumeta variegata TaxID=151549 RepID=A0A4C1YIC9_EUMVA|nr:hypothetical protein EVAR_53357_1 [Eumeta japonica]